MSGKSVLEGIEISGKRVLDIGCGNGMDLANQYCRAALERHGIDPDARAINDGHSLFPELSLIQGYAEALPFPDAHFDVVMAIVSLPYTNIPKALKEIARVIKPGAPALLLLHDWRLHLRFSIQAAKERAWKRIVDLGYVTLASLVYAVTGSVPAKPSGARETFQCAFRVRRQLESAGFRSIGFEKRGRHFIARAVRAEEEL